MYFAGESDIGVEDWARVEEWARARRERKKVMCATRKQLKSTEERRKKEENEYGNWKASKAHAST